MCAASAFLAFAGLSFAASQSHPTFYYEMFSSMRRIDDGCRVCYGDDCLLLHPTRCEYFMEIDEITDKPERGGDGSSLDNMMSELAEQATMSWLAQECIPLISQYTTCNKENLCIGCKTCHCTTAGKWSCELMQRCRTDAKIVMSHRTLVGVIERLLEYETKVRRKRLVEDVTEKPDAKPISLIDIAEWMYGVTPMKNMETTAGDATGQAVNRAETNTQSTALNMPTESEYLGFEEVLKNIATDQIYKRRTSQLYENSEIAMDYMNLDDNKTTKNNTLEKFMGMLNAIEEGNDITESASDDKFVVDLYPHENENDYNDYYTTEYGRDVYIQKEVNNTFDMLPENNELSPVNIIKRDVSFVTDISNTTQGTTVVTTTIKTTTDKRNDLKKQVLIPLTNIISDKQHEVKELLKIRENLINIIEIFRNTTTINITEEPEKINSSDTNISIYKLDLYPDIHEDLRRINPNAMSKLLYKLKRDIYEVFRDISRIQKLSKTEGLPGDLRLLIRSMKYYVNKQGSIRDFKNSEIRMQKFNESIRFLSETNPTVAKSVVGQFVDILEVIDKDIPQCNDLSSASKWTKKIINRVIKQNHVKEFSLLGLKSYDSEYNLTNDLRTIGKSWPQLTAKLANSPPHEKLYAMKLLHFTLSGDMNKITDALTLIDFAHSRRMTPIETPMAEHLMDRINSGLISMKRKIQSLIKFQIEHERNQLRERSNIQQNKKDSFLKRIKNMLRSSKNEIIGMVKKKIPKTEIFRTIAQKKLKELSQKREFDNDNDEKTMLKWQNVLSVTRRKKRDIATHIKTMKSRMKNIIPRYLRGKINPALAKHKSKIQTVAKKKKTNKHKNKASSTVKPKTKTTSSLNLNAATLQTTRITVTMTPPTKH